MTKLKIDYSEARKQYIKGYYTDEARPDIVFNRITTHYGSGYAWSPQSA
jgi:hypothetical protein